ncbi:MAG: hypothetical protein JZD40_00240 [Sulfolobus sp.]|nr:hypothetical protein [Sulfolobus sp.]
MRVPKRILLADGAIITLNEVNEEYFCLKVRDLNEAINILKSKGYKETKLAKNLGETVSLIKPISSLEEIHVRVYAEDNCLYSHAEISRKYIQHLTTNSIPAILEVKRDLEELQPILLYKGIKVIKILEDENVNMREPKIPVPWLGIIFFLLGIALIKYIRR